MLYTWNSQPDSLIERYRPNKFSEVIGQNRVIKSLTSLKPPYPHSYLLHGPSGTGKTSVARLLVDLIGAAIFNVTVITPSVHFSQDSFREFLGTLNSPALGSNPIKVVIFEECDVLLNNLWPTILGDLETPANHVYFILCTTDVKSIPEAVRSRCVSCEFRVLDKRQVKAKLEEVALLEGLGVCENVPELIEDIAQACNGNMRMAYNMLLVNPPKDLDIGEVGGNLETSFVNKIAGNKEESRDLSDILKEVPAGAVGKFIANVKTQATFFYVEKGKSPTSLFEWARVMKFCEALPDGASKQDLYFYAYQFYPEIF